MDITENKNFSEGKRKALDLAESARQSDWTHPSFAAELFKGRMAWNLLMPYPAQNTDDKKIGDAAIATLRDVLKKHINPDEVDRTGIISEEALKALSDCGAFAIKIPKKYGGLGLSQVNYNRVLHFVASYCASTAVYLSAHQSIGVPQPLIVFGTEEQKQKFLPRFAKGSISAFALTEPDVGSDPAKMTTKAEPTPDGKHFIINGEKLWCTNGIRADIMVVMAQTPPKIVHGKPRQQITAFIVERAMGGVENVHRCEFMGLKGIQNGLLRFKDVKVPVENIIGGEGMGLKIALTTLNTGRLTMPAAVTGASKYCLQSVLEWSNERVQWGSTIGKHEAVASKIAAMSSTIFAMESVAEIASVMADKKETDIRLEAAMAKLATTEASWKIVDGAVQIRGGRGYETARSLKARGEKPWAVERVMRDARINTIIEGTSQIMRLFIAREAMDMHVRRIMSIVGPRVNFFQRIGNFFKAFGFYALWYPQQYLPGCSVPTGVPARLVPHFKFIGKTSKKLARNLFHAMMIYQMNLESKQHLLAKLVNVGTDLFSMSSALSRAVYLYQQNPNDDGALELADLFCLQARGRIKKQFQGLFCNRDKFVYKVAQNALAGKYKWLESDVF